MEIIVERVTNDEDIEAIVQIREQVFVRELGITLAHSSSSERGDATFLLARAGPDKEPVGSLCVMDTSHDRELHQSFALKFEAKARVARYTHLAVLKPYRGLNIPLAMMLEAYRRVIVPRRFDYTWLLFDVERAPDSFLVHQLGFAKVRETFVSEYGCRCPLVRDERSLHGRQVIAQAEQYLSQIQILAAHSALERSAISL